MKIEFGKSRLLYYNSAVTITVVDYNKVLELRSAGSSSGFYITNNRMLACSVEQLTELKEKLLCQQESCSVETAI